MKETGHLLKSAREQRGVSISEASLATKINSKTLEAIETGDENNLPQKTFLRGFVQSYASYLKMDVDHLMTTFKNEVGSTKPETKIEADDSQGAPTQLSEQQLENVKLSLSQEKKPSLTVKILGLVILIILSGLITVTYKFVAKYQADSRENQEIQVSPLAPPESSETPSAITTDETLDTMSEPLVTPEPGADLAKDNISPNLPIINPPATTNPVTPPTPKPVAQAEPAAAPTPAIVNTPQEIIIEALDTLSVKLVVDGVPQELKLNREQIHVVKAKSKIEVNLSNGGAANIIYNGRDQGAPGKLGTPVTVRYPK